MKIPSTAIGLGGTRFILKTSHANLQYWLSETTSSKVQRWRYAISEHDFAVEHIKGKFNYGADALSRLVAITVTGDKASIIDTFHGRIEGHSSIKTTLNRMKKAKQVWPGFEEDVRSFVQSCPVCQRLSSILRPSLGSNFSVDTSRPNEVVAMDTLGPLEVDNDGYSYILVLVDAMSRYADLVPLKSKEVPETAVNPKQLEVTKVDNS